MVKVNDVNKGGAERVDDLMRGLARGRIVLGAVAFALPGVPAKVLRSGGGPDAGRDYLTRMFGAREVALGVGYLLSRGESRKLWTRIGAAVDALDTVAGVKSRKALPLPVAAAGAGVAAFAAGLGAVKVTQDLRH